MLNTSKFRDFFSDLPIILENSAVEPPYNTTVYDDMGPLADT